MKKEIRLTINPSNMSEPAIKLLGELETKGWLKDGKIVFDETEEDEVFNILNKLAKKNFTGLKNFAKRI